MYVVYQNTAKHQLGFDRHSIGRDLSNQQWATAADLIMTLCPFMEVTEIVWRHLPHSFNDHPSAPGPEAFMGHGAFMTGGLDVLRDVMLRLINDKFRDVTNNDKLCVATTVDHRFKLLPFQAEESQGAVHATLMMMRKLAGISQTAHVKTCFMFSRLTFL